MRHIIRKNPYALNSNISTQPYTYHRCNHFSMPTLDRMYVKVIQYIYNHPKCKRVDIIRDVFGYKNVNRRDWYKQRACRGHQSALFANLLFADLIDYDSKFQYTITEKGLNMLTKCFQDAISEMCKPKQMTFNFFD